MEKSIKTINLSNFSRDHQQSSHHQLPFTSQFSTNQSIFNQQLDPQTLPMNTQKQMTQLSSQGQLQQPLSSGIGHMIPQQTFESTTYQQANLLDHFEHDIIFDPVDLLNDKSEIENTINEITLSDLHDFLDTPPAPSLSFTSLFLPDLFQECFPSTMKMTSQLSKFIGKKADK